jgi:hypothetical protein
VTRLTIVYFALSHFTQIDRRRLTLKHEQIISTAPYYDVCAVISDFYFIVNVMNTPTLKKFPKLYFHLKMSKALASSIHAVGSRRMGEVRNDYATALEHHTVVAGGASVRRPTRSY